MGCKSNKKYLKCNIIQISLKKALEKLGFVVGKHPLRSCIIPVILTALLSTGLISLRFLKGFEQLYSPFNGRSFMEREAVEKLFPLQMGNINLISVSRFSDSVFLILVPKDDGNILREVILDEAENIDRLVYNITISWQNESVTLKDFCVQSVPAKCQPNDVLQLQGKIEDIKKKKIRINYPFHLDNISQRLTIYGSGLGKVTTDENGNILEAKAIRLTYTLNQTTSEKREINSIWQEAFPEAISNIKPEHVRIERLSGILLDSDLSKITELSLPLLPIAISLMVIFAVLTCLTTDCVSSKPWVAIAGCISPILGVISAFGLLSFIGIPYVDINVAIPFLLTGIGLDDSFIMLASWRRTDPKQTIEQRLSETYSEAAVSITITSLTNFLSFCVGITMPYGMAQIYCSFAATSILFAYAYQITFFGGALAFDGVREQKQLHSVLCYKVKEEAERESPEVKNKTIRNKSGDRTQETQCFLVNCAELYISFIVSVGGKATVIACFLLYLISSAYFLTHVEEGMDFRDATSHTSYFNKFITSYYKYCSEYDPPIHVVINKTLDYSNIEVQRNVEEIIRNLSRGPNMADESYCISWLKYYLQSTKRFWIFYYGYNMSDPNDFIEGLKNVFLKFHNSRDFRQHIKFNHNETEIVASRFIMFSKNVDTSFEQNLLLTTLWRTSDSSIYPVFVHSYWFTAYNVLTNIVQACTVTLCIAAGVVTAIFFIFIPNLFCGVSIFITIGSIQIGVIGYMSWWGIPLGMISMMCLIISVGLSVDYASHISYAYLSCEEKSPNKKTSFALHTTGYPILQGCLSTVCSVITFKFGKTNALVFFFKVILLVMLIALFHGIFVIPVIMNVFDTVRIKIFNQCKNTSRKSGEIDPLKE